MDFLEFKKLMREEWTQLPISRAARKRIVSAVVQPPPVPRQKPVAATVARVNKVKVEPEVVPVVPVVDAPITRLSVDFITSVARSSIPKF
jgi:hypothetical protein